MNDQCTICGAEIRRVIDVNTNHVVTLDELSAADGTYVLSSTIPLRTVEIPDHRRPAFTGSLYRRHVCAYARNRR